MLSKAIENAQKKVEENNFGVRKNLIEYDDVMNYQREAIYSRRRNAIKGDKIEIDLQNMMVDTASIIVDSCEGYSFQDFEETVMARLSIDTGFDEAFYNSEAPQRPAGEGPHRLS
jgi:preprotein translocase subunit SecA